MEINSRRAVPITVVIAGLRDRGLGHMDARLARAASAMDAAFGIARIRSSPQSSMVFDSAAQNRPWVGRLQNIENRHFRFGFGPDFAATEEIDAAIVRDAEQARRLSNNGHIEIAKSETVSLAEPTPTIGTSRD